MMGSGIRWFGHRFAALWRALWSGETGEPREHPQAELVWLWLQTPGASVGRPAIF
jgi:hypothetical protein